MQQAPNLCFQSFKISLTYSPPKIEQVAQRKTEIYQKEEKFECLRDMTVLALFFSHLAFFLFSNFTKAINSISLFTWSYP